MWYSAVGCIVPLLLSLLMAPLAVDAQPATKVYRIGYLEGSLSGYDAQGEAFIQRLRELGYTEGQNLIIEARFADRHLERLPALAAELVQLKVDCLVVGGILAARAAKQATSTIPIVMLNASDDPVRQGLITSLARPGGNITGIIDIGEQLAGKRLEILKEAFPHIARVGHLSYKYAPLGCGASQRSRSRSPPSRCARPTLGSARPGRFGPCLPGRACRACRGAHCRASRFLE
jgi:putative tryptophan/tyrosine transport system substrate-binding protein